ncbi:hypothetical protein ABVT39_002447, partial [Epinephelus coioides]
MASPSTLSLLGFKQLSVDIMASPSTLSLLGFKQLSVSLVDCLKTPAGRMESTGSSPELSVLASRQPSVCVVDCMKTPGLNLQLLHPAEEQQSHSGIRVEFKEEAADCFENPHWYDTDIGAEVDLFKEEEESECDDDDPNWEDGGGGSGGLRWFIRDEDSASTLEQQEAEDVASEAGGGDKAEKSELRHHCERCGKSFARRSNVTRHRRYHCSTTTGTPSQPESEPAEQETFSCDTCSLTFRTKRHLRLHERIHTQDSENHQDKATSPRERCHTCKQCNKSFYLLHTLQQHLLVHTGEKPFVCEQCGKTCARRGDLKTHML